MEMSSALRSSSRITAGVQSHAPMPTPAKPANCQTANPMVTIPPGGGYMVELSIPDASLFPFVTHSFAYTDLGALGLLDVGNVPVPNMPISH